MEPWISPGRTNRRSCAEAASSFARNELNDGLRERDARHEFNRAGWQKCAEFGIHGLPIPKEYGGMGADPLTTVGVLESLGLRLPGQRAGLLDQRAHVDGADPAARLRQRGAEAALPAAALQRRADRRQRHERAGLRLGRLQPAHHRRAPRRPATC